MIYTVTPKETPFLQFLSGDIRMIVRFSGHDEMVATWGWGMQKKREGRRERHKWVMDEPCTIQDAQK
jgi:hypothetical protein